MLSFPSFKRKGKAQYNKSNDNDIVTFKAIISGNKSQPNLFKYIIAQIKSLIDGF